MNDERPTHLDLFSGIGGFAIAARRAGFRTIGFSEIEPYACKLLGRHWPDVPNWGDIRNLPTYWLRGLDLLTGGFPCQPYSLAGKRGGSRDNRALWPKMFRVIAETRPTWVLGENVPGLINLELDRVLSDLESLDYTCWPLVIPACAVDARHRRDRVWIVANASGGRFDGPRGWQTEQPRRTETLGASEDVAHALCPGTGEDHRGTPRQNEHAPLGARGRQQPEFGNSCEDVAHASGAMLHRAERNGHPARHRGFADGGEAVANAIGSGLEKFREQSARQEQPAIERSGAVRPCVWPTEPSVGRVVNGLPHRSHRLKGLGNAIVPQVAEVLLRAIHAQLRP